MLKIALATSVLFIGTYIPASAQVGAWRYGSGYTYGYGAGALRRPVIAANGRCRGVSYGTGARRCGSLSGGPAGGNSSRN